MRPMRTSKDQDRYPQEFSDRWKRGPWRPLGKQRAARSFNASVKAAADLVLLDTAIERYHSYCRANPWYTPMWGQTFFNNWRDWLPEERTEAMEDDPLNYHWTTGAFQVMPHDYGCKHVADCDDDLCQQGRVVRGYCSTCVSAYKEAIRR